MAADPLTRVRIVSGGRPHLAWTEGLTFSLRPKDPNHPDALPRWFVHFANDNKDAYDEKAKETKRHQLAKGGARLAQLLNAIWP